MDIFNINFTQKPNHQLSAVSSFCEWNIVLIFFRQTPNRLNNCLFKMLMQQKVAIPNPPSYFNKIINYICQGRGFNDQSDFSKDY